MRAIANGIQQESRSENPNTCGDAISRQAVLDGVDRYIYKAQSTGTQDDFYSFAELVVKQLPSVTPQQRTGQWIKQNYGWNWQCSECVFVTPPSAKEIFTFCPNCGAKMEVEE